MAPKVTELTPDTHASPRLTWRSLDRGERRRLKLTHQNETGNVASTCAECASPLNYKKVFQRGHYIGGARYLVVDQTELHPANASKLLAVQRSSLHQGGIFSATT
jgi:hypothetical protein